MFTRFSAFAPPNKKKNKEKVNAISTPLTLSPPLEASPRDTGSQSLVIGFLSLNPVSRFSDHHKQDFSLVASTLNYKVIKIHHGSACHSKLHTSPHPTSKAHSLFSTARGRSKEDLSIPGVTQENVEPTPPSESFN